MRLANYRYLANVIGPLNAVPVAEEQIIYESVDPDDETAVSDVLRRFIKPDFERLTPDSQERCKDSLQYFLTTGNAPFEEIIDEQQESPLRTPSRPVDLFLWAWHVLFPGEDYHLSDLDDWEVDNNPSPPQLRYRPG